MGYNCYNCILIKHFKGINKENKCAFCHIQVEGKLLCLWDAIGCFHIRAPCIGLCKNCYSKNVGE